jgi:hypothetical protein
MARDASPWRIPRDRGGVNNEPPAWVESNNRVIDAVGKAVSAGTERMPRSAETGGSPARRNERVELCEPVIVPPAGKHGQRWHDSKGQMRRYKETGGSAGSAGTLPQRREHAGKRRQMFKTRRLTGEMLKTALYKGEFFSAGNAEPLQQARALPV